MSLGNFWFFFSFLPYVCVSNLNKNSMFGVDIHTFLCMLCYAKSLQSCPTLCDPRDSSPPGSPVPRILQARILEWVAISFNFETGQLLFSQTWNIPSKNLAFMLWEPHTWRYHEGKDSSFQPRANTTSQPCEWTTVDVLVQSSLQMTTAPDHTMQDRTLHLCLVNPQDYERQSVVAAVLND